MSQQNENSDQFERKQNPSEMSDSVSLRRLHHIRERQVCRIEVPCVGDPTFGSGVLIAPHCILTNWHVVEKFDPLHGKIKVTFDFKNDTDGVSIRDAKPFELDDDCVLIHSPYATTDKNTKDETLPSFEELDFAVICLGEAIGEERGWCLLPKTEHNFQVNEPITILQHPGKEALKIDTDAYRGWNGNRTRVYYITNTDEGSSGAPCFDKKWNLVAIHHVGNGEYNQGIPAQLIRSFLEKSKVWASLLIDAEQPSLSESDNVHSKGSGIKGPFDLKDYLPIPFFGRKKDVAIVKKGVEQYQRFAIVGPGGIGKTAIAAKSILSLNPELLKDDVVSHNFYQDASTEAMALSIARPFIPAEQPIEKPLEAIRSILAHHKPFIYLEGCEKAEDNDLSDVLELIGSCPYLITTRDKHQCVGICFHEVDSIESSAAAELLCHHAGIDDQKSSEVVSLCEVLGWVPLALILAGGWISMNQETVAELFKTFEEEGLSALKMGERQNRSIPLLLKKTASCLSETALAVWAVLGQDVSQPVSISVIRASLQLPDSVIRKAFGELSNYCLVTRYEGLEYGIDGEKHYALKHRLIYTYGRNELAGKLSEASVQKIIHFYLSRLGDWQIGKGFKNYIHCIQLLPYFRNAKAISERVLGPEHSDTLISVNNLAGLHSRMGEYEKAKPLYGRALDARERILGPEHPSTLISVNNLAGLHSRMGEYEKAKPLYGRALDARERVLGPEHPDTLSSVNNFAGLHERMGEYEKAKPLYGRALDAREHILGPEHPDTLISVNNLAGLHSRMGEYEKAKPLCDRALDARERVLGPEHPSTLISVNNLAGLHSRMGEYEKAKPLYERALDASERVLGPEHPDTLISVNNLAGLHSRMGEYEKAKPLYGRALDARERVLGPEHPSTLISVNNFAGLHERMGEYEKAKPLYERALEGFIKKLGEDHPHTKIVSGNLERVRGRLG